MPSYHQPIRHTKQLGIIFLVCAVGGVVLLAVYSLLIKDKEVANSNETSLSTKEEGLPQETPYSLLFVGDIMLDRAIARTADSVGYEAVFDGFAKQYASVNAVIGNLEGSVTTNDSLSKFDYKQMKFTFDPKIVEVLKKMNFKAVSLANNHALDFGTDGYHETVRHLDEQSIASFGSPLNGAHLSYSMTINTSTICFVGYHDLFTHNPSPALMEIEKIEPQCPFTVVMPHWGEEYQDLPTDRQRELGKKFIDAGADAVIGAHPHVVQPLEIYNNKPIFYSLGNHIFDQKLSWETEHGASVRFDKTATSTTYTIIGSAMNNFEVHEASVDDTPKIIDRIIAGAYLSEPIEQSLKASGSFTLSN